VTEFYGILLIGYGSSGPLFEQPVWLTAYDPDGGNPAIAYPTGVYESDPDPSLALRFETPRAATEFWRQQSTRTPYRPDMHENRPLTALSVEITRIPS